MLTRTTGISLERMTSRYTMYITGGGDAVKMIRAWRDGRAVRIGLTTGSIAAVAGVLANLPLDSPSDSVFNSAPVMAASLLAGLAAGALWCNLNHSPGRSVFFGIAIILVFGMVSGFAVAGESQMERSVSYIVPLAAIVLGLTGALTVLLSRIEHVLSWKIAILAVIAAVALGVGLAGYGDQESGRLELPPRTTEDRIEGHIRVSVIVSTVLE